MSVLNLIRPDLIEMKPYTSIGDDLACRLHANELPWSPTKLANLSLNRYPNKEEQDILEAQIANLFQVKSEELVLTRGSDEAIDFLIRFFLTARQDSFMQCPPTFPMYEFYSKLQQVKTINCPLDPESDFNFTAEQLISLWQPSCKLIMLCSPNNPTGTLIEITTIAKLCDYFKDKAVIVVDEAYIEFAKTPSATTLLPTFDNLIILRTLSKAHGLAGLRLGAILAQPQLITAMQNAMPPYTLSSAVIHLAQQALADKEWFSQKIEMILEERELLIAQLKQSRWIERVYPTHANFILVDSTHAQSLALWFAKLGIAVRQLQNRLRFTVGDSDQNQCLLNALACFKGASDAKNNIG